jgi:hypothetical protein
MEPGGKTMKRPSNPRRVAGKRSLWKEAPPEEGTKKKAGPGAKRVVTRRKKAAPLPTVEFLFSGIEAREVFLCGDFNSWEPHSVPLKKNQMGEWEAVVPLAPGRYEFKTLADGAWIENGGCKARVEGTDFILSLPVESVFNSFGTRNLAVRVR